MNKVVSMLKDNIKAIVNSNEYQENMFKDEILMMKEYRELLKIKEPTLLEIVRLNELASNVLNKLHLDDLTTPLELSMLKRVKIYGLEVSGLKSHEYSVKDFYSNIADLFHEVRWSKNMLKGFNSCGLPNVTFDSLAKRVEFFNIINGNHKEFIEAKEKTSNICVLSNTKLDVLKRFYETGEVELLDKLINDDIEKLINQAEVLGFTASIKYVVEDNNISKKDALLISNDIAANLRNYHNARKDETSNKIKSFGVNSSYNTFFRNLAVFSEKLNELINKEEIATEIEMSKMGARLYSLSNTCKRLNSNAEMINNSAVPVGFDFYRFLETYINGFQEFRTTNNKRKAVVFSNEENKIVNGIALSNGKHREYDALDYALFAKSLAGVFEAESIIRRAPNSSECPLLKTFAARASKARFLVQPMLIEELHSYVDSDFSMACHPEVVGYLENSEIPLFGDVVNAVINRFEAGTLYSDSNDKGKSFVKKETVKKETE